MYSVYLINFIFIHVRCTLIYLTLALVNMYDSDHFS